MTTYYVLNAEKNMVITDNGPFVSAKEHQMMLMKKDGDCKLLLADKDKKISYLEGEIQILKWKLEAATK